MSRELVKVAVSQAPFGHSVSINKNVLITRQNYEIFFY
jgi:hypothetical protein